jgi:microcystin-dependent protein
MSDQYLGEIRIFPYNFAPAGWALCNGQILPISQYSALFSLLGTMYGGNGQSNFALPDLQGLAPMKFGQGANLTDRIQGESGGEAQVPLLLSEIPPHTHNVAAVTNDPGAAATDTPSAATIFGVSEIKKKTTGYVTVVTQPQILMNVQAVTAAGGSVPHNNISPYLTFNFCIALEGNFPPRG